MRRHVHGRVQPQSGSWYFAGVRCVEAEGRRYDVVLRESIFNVKVTLGSDPLTGDFDADAATLNPLWGETEAVLCGMLDSLGFHLGAKHEVGAQRQNPTGVRGCSAASGIRQLRRSIRTGPSARLPSSG